MSAFRRRLLIQCQQNQKHYPDRIISDVRINHPGSIAVRSGQNVAEFVVLPNTRYKLSRTDSSTGSIWRKGESNIAYADVDMELNNYYNMQQGALEYEFTTVSDTNYLYVWSSNSTDQTSIWLKKV